MSLQGNLREMSEATAIVRGDMGFGNKVSDSAMERLATATGNAEDVHHFDQVTGETTIETVQDVSSILEANKRDRLSGNDGYSPSRDMRHVARIPLGLVNEFHNMGLNIMNPDDWKIIKGLLDDNDYLALRTSDGKLSSKPRRQYIVPAGR